MGIRALIPQKAINYLKHLPLAALALLYYRFPSRGLKIVGVTGTDGKTTTVSLINHILKEAGLTAAMISTVSAKIGEEEIDTGFHVTAPESRLLQRLLRKIADQKIEFVVLEVTSHGLDQFRFWGINYEVGIITNVAHEHLDYHRTFENYLRAKEILLKHAKVVVLNKDDESFEYFAPRFGGKKIITYGLKNEANFTLKKFPFKTGLVGEFNQYNALAAAAAASAMSIDQTTIRRAISSFKGVSGRMEEVSEGQNFRVIVDFAHTPNALEQVLKTLKEDLKEGFRLIVVFGSAGLRDKEKRPMMGVIAGRLADEVILTAEDPRTERVEDICREIAAGCRKAGVNPTIILDRGEAIEYAVKKAKKGDIVVVCGKGHEKSMCFGEKEFPWSDQEAVRKALRDIIKRKENPPSHKASEGKK